MYHTAYTVSYLYDVVCFDSPLSLSRLLMSLAAYAMTKAFEGLLMVQLDSATSDVLALMLFRTGSFVVRMSRRNLIVLC
jgi:hypothetical protein